MRNAPWLIVLMLVGAGCVGSAGTSEVVAPSVSLEPNQGLLGGRVTDAEFRPIPNATVGIASSGLVQTTAADGRFLFGALEAGPYEVSAYALGYQAAARLVNVDPGQRVDVTFSLEGLPSDAPYFQVFPFTGFESCQWYVPIALATCSFPYTAAYGAARQNGVNLSSFGAPRDLQDNRDRYNFTVGLDHTGVVSELIWQSGSALASIQALVIACAWYDPVADECVPPGAVTTGVRYFATVGTSPLRIEWKHPNAAHHKLSPWIMSRANVNGNATERPAGIALDQKIQMYNTVFYGAPPPEGFTLGADG